MGGDLYAQSLDVDDDGSLLAVGAPLEGEPARGAVKVYSRDPAVGVVVTDPAYCAARAAASFSGACIAAAIADAEGLPGAIAEIVLVPGAEAKSRFLFRLNVVLCGVVSFLLFSFYLFCVPLPTGVYSGCLPGGVLITRSDLVITSMSPSALRYLMN